MSFLHAWFHWDRGTGSASRRHKTNHAIWTHSLCMRLCPKQTCHAARGCLCSSLSLPPLCYMLLLSLLSNLLSASCISLVTYNINMHRRHTPMPSLLSPLTHECLLWPCYRLTTRQLLPVLRHEGCLSIYLCISHATIYLRNRKQTSITGEQQLLLPSTLPFCFKPRHFFHSNNLLSLFLYLFCARAFLMSHLFCHFPAL